MGKLNVGDSVEKYAKCLVCQGWGVVLATGPHLVSRDWVPHSRTCIHPITSNNYSPAKLTWNLKTTGLWRKLVFHRSIFRFHVHVRNSSLVADDFL